MLPDTAQPDSRMGRGMGQLQNHTNSPTISTQNKRKVLKPQDFRTFLAFPTDLDMDTKACNFNGLRPRSHF